MTNINNSLNKEEENINNQLKNYFMSDEERAYLQGKLNGIETAQEILNDSELLQEDKTDLLILNTIKGKYKRQMKGGLK